MRSSGVTMHEGFVDEAAFARICMSSHQAFGYDNVMAGWGDLLVEAHAHGTEWKFPERDFYPRVARFAVQEPSDVDRLQPVDPMEDEHWSVPLRAASLLRKRLGSEAAVVGCTISPFFLAAQMRGFENMLMDTFTDRDMVERMVEVALRSSIMYADRAAEAGVDAVFIDDSTATGELMSPEMAADLDIATLRPLISHMRNAGTRVIVHNDAKLPYLGMQASASPTCLHFCSTYADVPSIIGDMRGRMPLMPGIDHQELMFRGRPEDVENAVTSLVRLYGNAPGLIIAPGCEMPFKTPIENITRLREACERLRH